MYRAPKRILTATLSCSFFLITLLFGNQCPAQQAPAKPKKILTQLDGGTVALSFQMQCNLKLTRDHFRELDTIYGNALHM